MDIEILNILKIIDKHNYAFTNSKTMLVKSLKNIDRIFAHSNVNWENDGTDVHNYRKEYYLTLYKEFAPKERDKEGVEIMVE